MVQRSVILYFTACVLTALPLAVSADEVDDALNVEKPASAVKQTDSPAAQVTEKAPAAAPVTPKPAVYKPAPRMSPVYSTVNVHEASLLSALEKKQSDLDKANAEIARLKDLIRKMVEINRKEQANMHYNMGCVYKAGRLFKKAESEFLQALKITPDDPSVHYNLGVLYDDDLKDMPKAKEHYKKFLKLAPGDPDAPQVEEWLIAIPGE